MENVVLYILGFPGTGKYTIAREMCAREPNFRLVDNHLINNPVFSVIQHDGLTAMPECVWDNVDRIRDVVMDTLINISPRAYSFVLTNALLDSLEDDKRRYSEVEDMAKARGAVFVPVRLLCSVKEMERRIVSEERARLYKEVNPDAPRRYVEGGDVLKCAHENLFNLDVTELTAEQAAAEILARVKGIVGDV